MIVIFEVDSRTLSIDYHQFLICSVNIRKELLRIHRLSHSINFLSQEKVNSPTKMDLSMRDLSTNTEDMVKENGS